MSMMQEISHIERCVPAAVRRLLELPPSGQAGEAVALCALHHCLSVCDAAGGLPDRRALALRGRATFSALRRLALRCEDALEVSRLLSDMHALAGGLFAGGRAPLLDTCGEVLSRLLGLAWETASRTDGGLRAALCGNLTDALSATPTDASGLRPFLDATLDGWVTSQSPDGGWPGLPAGAALERVIVLNRRSFLLLDRRADAPVALAYARCRRAALSELAGVSPRPFPFPCPRALYTALAPWPTPYPVDPVGCHSLPGSLQEGAGACRNGHAGVDAGRRICGGRVVRGGTGAGGGGVGRGRNARVKAGKESIFVTGIHIIIIPQTL